MFLSSGSKSNQKSPASAADDAHSCKSCNRNFKTDGGLQAHNHDKRRGSGQSLDVKFQRPGVQAVISLMAMVPLLLNINEWNECYDNEDELQSFRHKARQQDKVYEEREESCWILHLRTGIFYPKGHEGVMNEVPDGAAIFASNRYDNRLKNLKFKPERESDNMGSAWHVLAEMSEIILGTVSVTDLKSSELSKFFDVYSVLLIEYGNTSDLFEFSSLLRRYTAIVMVIDDKSWTLLERHERAFYIGLEKFVDHCKPLVNSAGKIKCPCKSCRNILWVHIKHLSDHIMRHGFDLGYKTWVHHGEPDLPPPPPVIDNTRQPQMSDMTALLNDLSYIPPNNEHNEPTQGDIGETSNEPTQATRNEFEELYASANEELYPGCDYVTRLDFMAKFTYFKVKGKLTDSIFNEMLEFFQNVFPISKGYKLPPSYYAIKKTFKMIGLGYESIHACVNDCFLFRGDNNKDVHFCPVGFVLKDEMERQSKHTREEGKFLKKVARLNSVAVILTTYNLPPWLCMKESSFMLTLLIPGPKSPGKDIDVYLRPLIDDLKVLWALKGVETIDVATGQKFNMRAMVLWTINDFPA
ncbi:hypothetical protein Tco_0881435 [Tanacetum coccineum]